jgi:hypothetical protein
MREILCAILFMVSPACIAQTGDSLFLYRRGSIYSLMIGHRSLQFEQEIEKAFDEMPVPDKYNDHGLGKKVFYTTEEKLKQKGIDDHEGFVVNGSSKREDMNDFDFFLQRQHIASRLVAKWFQRKKGDGICNMELVQERGYNNASEVDKRLAALSVRKDALLMDAGEELIGSTFVLINDIRYIDKSRGSSVIGGAISAVSKGAALLQGNSNALEQKDLGDLIASYKGFNVKIKTYLYQLVWDEEISSFWYNNVYTESKDESKKEAFENNRGKFSLVYLGMQESSGKDISFAGVNESKPQIMVRKACQRAFDENIANLQKNFEPFKVKAPLLSTDPITCEIGKKEGITEDSRYEVLETVEDEKGHVEYKRVGVIKPQKDMIWDNRYMAKEENAKGADLGFTTFVKVRGGDFYPGMLIREMK